LWKNGLKGYRIHWKKCQENLTLLILVKKLPYLYMVATGVDDPTASHFFQNLIPNFGKINLKKI